MKEKRRIVLEKRTRKHTVETIMRECFFPTITFALFFENKFQKNSQENLRQNSAKTGVGDDARTGSQEVVADQFVVPYIELSIWLRDFHLVFTFICRGRFFSRKIRTYIRRLYKRLRPFATENKGNNCVCVCFFFGVRRRRERVLGISG